MKNGKLLTKKKVVPSHDRFASFGEAASEQTVLHSERGGRAGVTATSALISTAQPSHLENETFSSDQKFLTNKKSKTTA